MRKPILLFDMKPILKFDIMRNSVKAVFVKPRFIMRVFIVKNEGTERFV